MTSETKALNVQTTIDVPLQRLWYVLLTGFQVGIGY